MTVGELRDRMTDFEFEQWRARERFMIRNAVHFQRVAAARAAMRPRRRGR